MELDVLSDGIESSTALPSCYLYPASRQALSLDLSMDDDRGGAVDAGVDRYEVGHDKKPRRRVLAMLGYKSGRLPNSQHDEPELGKTS